MSNVSNLILSLQEKLETTSNTLELATVAKVIEKLKIRSVSVVQNFSDLPTGVSDGNVFLIKQEGELYYNVGTTWFSLGKITTDTIFGFGFNTAGQLADNTVVNRSSPVTVIGGVTSWSFIAAGGRGLFGIADGILYAWGCATQGNLGDGFRNVNRSSPVTVVGGITNWTQVSASADHGLAIAGGIAYGWGTNNFFGTPQGSVGDGTTINRSSPVTVVGGITNWNQVSAGGIHSLGLTENGITYAWGNNIAGRLGDNTSIDKSSPVTVVGGITNWSQVSAGGSHSIAIASGVAYAWGNNTGGRLGDGTTLNRSSPVTVVGGITNWSQVSTGYAHNVGITNGIAYAWGNNTGGRLGDGTIIAISSPVTVVGGITNWSQVSGGNNHSLGITNTGVAYAWGGNAFGQLGDNTLIEKSSPVTVVGGITNWSQISAGSSFTILLANDLIKRYIQ
jgi:alpha-tubulin suppressor-like RCC1 family protein